MKWRVRKPSTRERALHWWHVWYAWHPVRVPTIGKGSDQKMIWLEPVWRKGRLTGWSLDDNRFDWEYKERVKE